MKLSIIIPAYNEEATIAKLLKKVIKAKLSIKKEIIVVDDGSTDSTFNLAKKFKGIKLIGKDNGGKGSAIKYGLKYATGDIVIIQDADLEYDPNDYQIIIDPILNNEADVVYGSRWMKKENRKWANFTAYIGGRLITWSSRFFNPNIPTDDEPTCYKAVRKTLLDKIKLERDGFEFCPEITAKLSTLKPRFKQVPIHYYPRSFKEGKKIKPKDLFIGIYTLIRYSNLFIQGIKFYTVGGITTLFNLGLLWFLTEIIGLHYMISAAISVFIAATSAFFLHRIFTYN